MAQQARTTLRRHLANLLLTAAIILLFAAPAATLTSCTRKVEPPTATNASRVFVTFVDRKSDLMHLIRIDSSGSEMHVIHTRTGEVVFNTPLSTLDPDRFTKELNNPSVKAAIAAHQPESETVLCFSYSDTRWTYCVQLSPSAKAVDAVIEAGSPSLREIKSALQELPKAYRRY